MQTGNLKWFLGLSLAAHVALLGLWTRPLTDIGRSGHIINLKVLQVAGDTAAAPLSAPPTDTPENINDNPPATAGEPPASPETTDTPLPAVIATNAVATKAVIPAAPQAASVAAAGPVAQQENPEHHLRDTLLELVTHNLRYPAIARRKGWQGIVVLQLRIESGGEISRLQVNESSGYPVLDRAAVECLQLASIPQARRWLNGEAVEILVPVEYRLVDS
jgi:protein TonB